MADFDLAIIGGGPAGLVAAAYALHARLKTGVFTRELGGKVNYPFALRDVERAEPVWGANLVHEFEERVIANPDLHHSRREVLALSQGEDKIFTLRLAPENNLPRESSHANDNAGNPDGISQDVNVQENPQHIIEKTARAVIVATGAAPQRLYVYGEKEYWGKGVSFSAISHAPFFTGRDVAVVGGGRRALVAALTLNPICRRVYFIAANAQVLEDWPEARLMRNQENISVFKQWEVQQILGDDFVTGIGLVGANGETRLLDVEGVFIELALLPNNEIVRDLAEFDQHGHIRVDQRCATSVPGLFAAGDVTNIHVEQVMVAIGEGAKAALSAWEYLSVQA